MQDHDDDEEGGGGGGSSASKTFAKLKEMGAEMKVGMTKLAEKKVRMFQLERFRLKPKPKTKKYRDGRSGRPSEKRRP